MSVSAPTVRSHRIPMTGFALAGLFAIAGAGIVAAVANDSDSTPRPPAVAAEVSADRNYASPSDYMYRRHYEPQTSNAATEAQDPLITRFGR